MDVETRCLPVGALPYDNLNHATAMMAKLFSQNPYIALLPNMSDTETLENRIFNNIPGVEYNNGKLVLSAGTPEHEAGIAALDKACKSPNLKHLESFSFEAKFLEKYFHMIKKFNSKNAYVNILGPFTVSQMLTSKAEEQSIADKKYRKLFAEAVCVKGLWAIEKIKQACSSTAPVVILEEPMLNQLGAVKRQNPGITAELVTNLFSNTVETLKNAGAAVGVQCMGKCDWSVPINAGVDIISFDAYNNPNNLTIIPDILTEYLKNGGMINWGIVPVVSDSVVKDLTVDYLYKRLSSTIEGVILSGVPAGLLYKSALVSVNGDMDKLPVMFSEKALILAIKLGSRLALRG